jgi:hypothetical protein
LGQAFVVGVANVPTQTPVALMIGFSNTIWQGIPLPLALDFMGAFNCSLYNSIEISRTLTSNTLGIAQVGIPVPFDFNLVGLQVYFELAAFDSGANPLQLVFTRGGGVTLQQ